MNYTLPIVISSGQYMLHFDNAPIGFLDLDSKYNNTLTYETISGRKTYQVIAGGGWEELLSNYTSLTGRQPLPPRWAFGNFASRFGYHSEAETRNTIVKFREDKIPVDAVILDLIWFGKDIQGTLGNLEVYRDSFPNFEKMIADFDKIGVKTIPITEPFILTTSSKWKEAVEENVLATDSIGNPFTYDFYFGNTGLIDLFKPKGRQWFWEIYRRLAEMGVAGVWGDLGEPEVHPSNLYHAIGSADEVHNIYGHSWAQLVYEGYRSEYPNQRPFILMRSGAAGSQRFGLIPWSGDVNRSWGGLKGQTEISLQMGMQGLAYMHSDLGGFAGNNLDDELYVRWLQYGVFQPGFRPHAQEDVPSEPVFRSSWAKDLARKAIELRYQLIPYQYTLAFDNEQYGLPFMRPLFFEEPENRTLLAKSDGYLWGSNFLIYPITEPNQQTKEVYFPKGSWWFDFYSGKMFKGGTKHLIDVTSSHIPTYVRAGSFIPKAEIVQSTKDYTLDGMEIHYYYHSSLTTSKGQLYTDDGITPNAYELGVYEKWFYSVKKEKGSLNFKFKSIAGEKYNSEIKRMEVVVHNIYERPRKVLINNKRTEFHWDEKSGKASILVDVLEKGKEIKIRLYSKL